jgi:hypothetical protein
MLEVSSMLKNETAALTTPKKSQVSQGKQMKMRKINHKFVLIMMQQSPNW